MPAQPPPTQSSTSGGNCARSKASCSAISRVEACRLMLSATMSIRKCLTAARISLAGNLGAERDALAAPEREIAFGHQQPELVLLLGQRGQQHARRLAELAGIQAGDGFAQHRLQRFGEQMLLVDRELVGQPGLADALAQRSQQLLDRL